MGICARRWGLYFTVLNATSTQLELQNIPQPVEDLLCKNGFLSNYGRTSVNDIFSSTIPYKRFEPNEGRYFNYYIENEFGNKNIPGMSDGLRGKFLQSLLEVFQNSVTHSHTKMGIYACGQYFHKNSWSNFTIVDLGRGIRNNLLEEIGKDLPPEQAIHWAMEGNTTKKGIPGGLGLKLLREFAQLNQGTIQVVSERDIGGSNMMAI